MRKRGDGCAGRRARRAGLALLGLLAGCGVDAPGLHVTTGHEEGSLDAAPRVERFLLGATLPDGSLAALARAGRGEAFALEELDPEATLGFEVLGLDAEGRPVARGASPPGLRLESLEGSLPIFVARTGSFARPPGGLDGEHRAARAAPLGWRFLLLAGSAPDGEPGASNAEAYDLLSLTRRPVAPLPRPVESLVTLGPRGLVVDAAGASWVDFGEGKATEAALPAGLGSFADVAGGAAVSVSGGVPSDGAAAFVVGPTRTSAPSRAVLRVGADGKLAALALEAARRGAAAAWTPGLGLVVAGGFAEGAGVELLRPGLPATPLPFPPDPVEGAGALAIGAEGAPFRVLLAGGVLPGGAPAPTRLLDPSCGSACAPEHLAGADLPVAGLCELFPAPASSPLASAGSPAGAAAPVAAAVCEGSGSTRIFALTLEPPSATELPLREPRALASAAPIPGGALAVAGGILPSGKPAPRLEILYLR